MLTLSIARRALVALLLAVPLVATGGTAQAAACSGSTGVTVVVQFTGGTVTACAPGDPSSGTQALTSAGFSVTFVNGRPFVCKINAQPSNQTCGGTPPADAYWAYFHAKRGGSWSYSSTGAASYDPAPGSVEGWRFGSGAKPSTAPPAAPPKPKPAPKPTPKPSTAGIPTASASAAATDTPSAKAEKSKAAQKKAAQRKAAAKNARKKKVAEKQPAASVSVAAPATSSTADAASPVDQTAAQQAEGGGNVPWLWGLVGLVAIGGAAGAVTLVRRRG